MPSAGAPVFACIVVPTPYAVGPANVYVFAERPVTLFDCGPNTPATEAALLRGLADASVDPATIERIVVSHGHPDHFGMAPRLQELSGATVYAGAHDVPKLADHSMIAATGRLLLRAGMPMEELVAMGDRERSLGPIRPRVPGVVPVEEGTVFELETFALRTLHMPGHTGGHICLWHEPSGTLFSGDTLLAGISPNPLLEPDPRDPAERRRSLVEYLGTLDRLASMPLAVVHPGHGPTIEDPHALIERMRAHHRRRTEELDRLLDGDGKTGWDLANELFTSLEGFDNFLAVSEVVAHLDLLVLDGRAQSLSRDGVTYYRRAGSP